MDVLENEKTRILDSLYNTNPTDKDYSVLLENLMKVEKAIEVLKKQPEKRFKISQESIFNAAVGFGELLLIMNFERGVNLINKTALGMRKRR